MIDFTTYQHCLAQASQYALPKYPSQHFLCYVVYGDNSIYYEGIKVSILSLFAQIDKKDRPTIVVLSQRPDYFTSWENNDDIHLINLNLTNELMNVACQDNYHYRLKTIGLAYIIDTLVNHHIASQDSKFLFFDSDTYFITNPLALYEKINTNQVVMYKQEPKIFAHKKYRNYLYGEINKKEEMPYCTGIKDKTLSYHNPTTNEQKTYQLDSNASMYSSLIMGVMPNSVPYLFEVANLMYPMRQLTNARTVEQFCFVEIMKQHYHIAVGQDFVKHFSRKRQKAYVESQLNDFWRQYPDDDFEQQVKQIKHIRFERPFWLILSQAIQRIFKPEHIR